MKCLTIIKKLTHSKLIILLTGFILVGCGGGASTESLTNPNTSNSNLQPRSLTSADMLNVRILARDAAPAPHVSNNDETITITHADSEIDEKLHYQFFINSDNDAKTGFNFDNEIWDDAGTDYIVEDGYLYKSTANDSSWSWDTNAGEIDYKLTNTSVSVTINQALLKDLAPQIRIGFIIRDENWDVISIWPGASLMALASLDVAAPADTTAPVISLNGSQNITLQRGTPFNDPGATAFDNFDGDISDQILSFSNLDTSTVGNYQVTYEVIDLAGNKNTKIRTILVTENASNSIVVDGQINDWSDIPVLASSAVGSIKVTDTIANIYILVEGYEPLGKNTQIFIDSDNSAISGFRFNDSVWPDGGSDFMVENNHLSRSTANSSGWAWEHGYRPISYIKSNNIIEIAIPKTVTKEKQNLSSEIKVGFVNRTADWDVISVLPESGMESYKLTAIKELQLIPGFCGKIWETDGTAENTQESFANLLTDSNEIWSNIWRKNNNTWFGVRNRYDDSFRLVDVSLREYNGTTGTSEFLPFSSFIRNEPLNNSSVTNMEFVGDTLYFLFNKGKELWRTDGTSSGTLRINTFDDDTSNTYSLFTTSSDVYVYERVSGSDGVSKLWKVENGEFLTEIDLSGDAFLGFYKDKLYTSRKDDSGSYFVIENSSGGETILSPSFTAQPGLSSTNGALYISDASGNDRFQNIIKYIWKLNDTSGTFTRVTQNNVAFVGSVSSTFNSMSIVQGNEFIVNRRSAFSRPTATFYSIVNSEERTVIKKTGRIISYYLDNDLYVKAKNYLSQGIRQTEINNELLVINDPSGNLKTLAKCEITQ